MSLNKKGFAITTILYGLLILGTLLLFLLISTVSFEHKSTTDFAKQITKQLNQCVANRTC